ncbi:hypothetical protein VTJ04DRAFT_3190 [Mycothermus thermophilus]|uniref:uncharacterized protein n=1 Tax=Humicola insolens TaxID=85995 RepID=UPI00374276C2
MASNPPRTWAHLGTPLSQQVEQSDDQDNNQVEDGLTGLSSSTPQEPLSCHSSKPQITLATQSLSIIHSIRHSASCPP